RPVCPASGRCASTRRVALTVVPAGRWPWSTPRTSGTPSSIWPTSMRSSTATLSRAKWLSAWCWRRTWGADMLGRPASNTIDGPAGLLEVVVEEPTTAPRGLAVVAHPNPQQGGTMDNKVVHTLSRAFVLAGWRAVRFNFRGVGASQGRSTDGPGEIEDMMAVIDHHQADPALRGLPLSLAGFSFGGFVAASAHA